MVTWYTVQADTCRVLIVEGYPSLQDAIHEMALLAWEEPLRRWTDYLMDEATGEALAVAIFGPEHELLVTCADGRRLVFEMPESYRESAP